MIVQGRAGTAYRAQPATERPSMSSLSARTFDGDNRNEETMDQTFFQMRYEVDADAVAEAIIQRARLLRRLRREAAAALEASAAEASAEVFVAGD